VAAIILSNNIVPSSVILSKAENLGIPLLLVSTNTHQTARQIDGIEPLPTKEDTEKIDRIEKMIRDYVDLKMLQKVIHDEEDDSWAMDVSFIRVFLEINIYRLYKNSG